MIGFLPPRILDGKLEKEKNYWLQKLSGDLIRSGIPLDFRRSGAFADGKETVNIKIERDIESKLLGICGDAESLVFVVLVTAMEICLHKYTSVKDVVVGTTIHERYKEVAWLNKVLALRNQISSTATARGLLLDVKRTTSEAYANQKYPFDRILELLDIRYPDNRAPLFNVAVILDNINNRENIRHLKNDVTLGFSMADDGITATMEYNPRLFKRETIEVFGEHYRTILRAMLDRPDIKVSEIELLSKGKKRELVFNFNNTQSTYPKDKTICRLFEEQVNRTPDSVAVEFKGYCLTYRELNVRANQLAHHLQKLGVGPGAWAGIFLEHSLETIVGVLAILKAGGACVPLDPAHPRARLAFMLSDAQIPVVLTQKRLVDRLPASGAEVICLDSDWEVIAQESEKNPAGEATVEDLAYLIYTSGSTGQPKGVKIQHSSLVNYIWWAKEVYLRGESLAFPLYSSLAFDLTVTSIYTPLITGNRVIIYRQEGRESPVLEILRDNKVDVLKATPSHLRLIKDRDNGKCHIRRLIVGGEAFDADLAKQVYESFGGDVEIFNEYGPTEATVGCMIHKFHPARDDRAFVPVGKPAANVQIYILDERLNPVAENVIGELYISGDGLAQGYLNREELTGERFIENPFIPGARMYKTGDLARWLPEGDIEFLGRADDQVKFHGYRVELNGIACVLNQHPQVRNSVVVIKKDKNGHDVMMAYYISRQELESAQLRAFLSESIIEETSPNLFVHLKRMPLTLNGKVNYRALPTLDEARQRLKRTFVAPRTPVEEMLAAIWAQVLGLEQVSIHDNFFELGGHSLLATQVMSRVREAFQVELPMRCLFESPTVASLSLEIAQRQDEQWDSSRISVISRIDRGSEGQLLAEIDRLSDEKVDSLLSQMLAEAGS